MALPQSQASPFYLATASRVCTNLQTAWLQQTLFLCKPELPVEQFKLLIDQCVVSNRSYSIFEVTGTLAEQFGLAGKLPARYFKAIRILYLITQH